MFPIVQEEAQPFIQWVPSSNRQAQSIGDRWTDRYEMHNRHCTLETNGKTGTVYRGQMDGQVCNLKRTDTVYRRQMNIQVHMADHAGGRRSVVNPGTKLWRPPVEVTQYWRPRRGFSDRFMYDQKRLY